MSLKNAFLEFSISNHLDDINSLRRSYDSDCKNFKIDEDIELVYMKDNEWKIVYKGHDFASYKSTILSGLLTGVKAGALGTIHLLNMKTKDITVVNTETFKKIEKALKESIPKIAKEMKEASSRKWGK